MTQSRGTSDWLRGRSMAWVDGAVALFSPEMVDERQSAVLGQVSSAALSVVIKLNYAAGLAFMLTDNKRFEPCVWVFWVIALGAQAFTMAATRRQSVDLRTTVKVPTWGEIVFSSIAFGAIFFTVERSAGGLGYSSWGYDLVAAAFATLGWAFLLKRGQNRKQKAILLAESAADDDADDPADAQAR